MYDCSGLPHMYNVCTCTCIYTIPQPDPSHYYGFVYFRQVKDSDIRRGYFQKVLYTDVLYIQCTCTMYISQDRESGSHIYMLSGETADCPSQISWV